jgi:hypothetical protein
MRKLSMVKAHLSNGAVLFGLSFMNVEKLKQGKPIKFDGRPFGFPGDVIIVYGETEQIIARDILEATGVASTDAPPQDRGDEHG